MRARNEYIKVTNGKNEVIMRDVITDKYLSLFSKSQYETDTTKIYSYNYNKMMPKCFIKFDEPLDLINGRELKYKLLSEIATKQELITTNHTILSENNEIIFKNLNDDLISYKIYGKNIQENDPTPTSPSVIKTLAGNLEVQSPMDFVVIDLQDNELNSINSVCDEFGVTTGKLLKRVGKLILDGSENWEMHYGGGTFYLRSNPLSNAKMPNNNDTLPNIMCSHFKADTYNNVWYNKVDNTIGINNDGTSNPRIQFSQCQTVNEFKTWLQSNPITIYYELKEPIEVNLLPTSLPFFKNEITKDDFDAYISGIANSNGDKQSVITTYFYSTKNNIYNIKDAIYTNDLNDYNGRKITALGFGQNEIMAYFDTTNYSITMVKDCEFCISRRDIFTSDAICDGYDYPLHLATITPSINYSDGQYQENVYARLYSVGLGKTIGELEDEQIIGKDIDIKIVNDTAFSFIFKKPNQQSTFPKTTLFPGNGRYPMPYYTDTELYPSANFFCGSNRYPMASNYKYIIYKYRLYYINRGAQLVDLDQFYTMSLKNDAKGLFEILTKIERR